MKNLLTLVLIGLLVVGCSSVSQAGQATQPVAATPTPPGNPTGGASSGAADSQGAAAPGGVSRSLPLSVTVRPPAVPLQPVQGTPGPGVLTPVPLPNQGWQTFTSPSLGVVVDYPPDWSVTEQGDGATFTSPQGDTILLQTAQAGEENPVSLQCTSLMNAFGQVIDTCLDTASNRYSASMDLNASGSSTQKVTLSTLTKAALEVYKGMLNSMRPAQ